MNNECALRTGRLFFREIGEEDAEVIVKLRSNPLVYKFFRNPHALTIEEHNEWYKNKYIKDQDLISWIAFHGDMQVGVFQVRRRDENTGDISYLIAPEHQKKGYASESLKAIEQWMIKYWHISFARADIHKNNVPSIRFIQSMGYHFYERDGMFYIYQKQIGMNVKERC